MEVKRPRGRPKHVASEAQKVDTEELLLVERFLHIPSFAEHVCVEYTREQIIMAVMGYVLTGSSLKASQISGVNDVTIRQWKRRSAWWEDVCEVCREILSEKFEDRFTSLLNETLRQIETRLESGNKIVTESGKTYNRPLSAAELTKLLNILFDKRQLLRGDVTSRSENKTTSAHLDRLKQAAEDVIRKGYISDDELIKQKKD